MRTLVLTLLLLATTIAGAANKLKVSDWSDKYDAHFRKYSKHYFGPGVDWHWFKAQAIAESGLKPGASSKSGARGIMQIHQHAMCRLRHQCSTGTRFHKDSDPQIPTMFQYMRCQDRRCQLLCQPGQY